jgi:hypothetical protein
MFTPSPTPAPAVAHSACCHRRTRPGVREGRHVRQHLLRFTAHDPIAAGRSGTVLGVVGVDRSSSFPSHRSARSVNRLVRLVARTWRRRPSRSWTRVSATTRPPSRRVLTAPCVTTACGAGRWASADRPDVPLGVVGLHCASEASISPVLKRSGRPESQGAAALAAEVIAGLDRNAYWVASWAVVTTGEQPLALLEPALIVLEGPQGCRVVAHTSS